VCIGLSRLRERKRGSWTVILRVSRGMCVSSTSTNVEWSENTRNAETHLDPTLKAYSLLPSGERASELTPYDLPLSAAPLPLPPPAPAAAVTADGKQKSVLSSTELGLILLAAFFLKSHSRIQPSADPADARRFSPCVR
jgi:hypothetical protein